MCGGSGVLSTGSCSEQERHMSTEPHSLGSDDNICLLSFLRRALVLMYPETQTESTDKYRHF